MGKGYHQLLTYKGSNVTMPIILVFKGFRVRDDKYKTVCDMTTLGRHWSPEAKKHRNVLQPYVYNKNKHHQAEIIDLGVFCKVNNLNHKRLRLLLRFLKYFEKFGENTTNER